MKASLLSLALLPLASHARVQRMKLHKIERTEIDQQREAFHLGAKYGALQPQLIAGAGGAGRKLRGGKPVATPEGEELYWTQDNQVVLNGGGHKVPLSSTSSSELR